MGSVGREDDGVVQQGEGMAQGSGDTHVSPASHTAAAASSSAWCIIFEVTSSGEYTGAVRI